MDYVLGRPNSHKVEQDVMRCCITGYYKMVRVAFIIGGG